MGYNLHLYCETCDQRAMAWRGQESVAIRDFARLHRGDTHKKVSAIDNGYEEPAWLLEGSRPTDIVLPAEAES